MHHFQALHSDAAEPSGNHYNLTLQDQKQEAGNRNFFEIVLLLKLFNK